MTLINQIATTYTTLQTTDYLEIDRGGTSGKITWDSVNNYISRANHALVAANDSPADFKDVADYLCDGTSDNVEIQSAIDEVASAGGSVGLAPGKYNIAAQINIRNHGVYIRGLGGLRNRNNASAGQLGGGTILLAASGITGAVLDYRHATENQINSCVLENLTIDGNNNVGSGVNGIYWNMWMGRITNVHIFEMSGSGLYVTNPTTAIGDNVFVGLKIGYCTSAGLHLAARASDNHIIGLVSHDNQDGVLQEAASNQFGNLHTFSNSRNGLRMLANGLNTRIVNYKCEQSGEHNINFLADGSGSPTNILIAGLESRSPSQTTTDTHSHVKLDGAGVGNLFRIQIVGAVFAKNSAATNNAKYVLDLDARTNDCMFNDILWTSDSFVTGALNYNGAKRTLINGWGRNAGNPASAGDWNGATVAEGIMVRDTTNSLNYAYINGAWISL